MLRSKFEEDRFSVKERIRGSIPGGRAAVKATFRQNYQPQTDAIS
jgi:hypothetical protein